MWDAFWPRLQETLAQFGEQVRDGRLVRLHRSANEAFPFYATLSIGVNPEMSKELVVSVDCKEDGDSVVLACDLATGEGYVVGELNTRSIPVATLELGALLAWHDEIAAFLSERVGEM